MTEKEMTKGTAFVKGGFGCIVLFFAIALLFLLFGGSAHVDVGGLILLFIIGGCMGLLYLFVYNKGKIQGDKTSLALTIP